MAEHRDRNPPENCNTPYWPIWGDTVGLEDCNSLTRFWGLAGVSCLIGFNTNKGFGTSSGRQAGRSGPGGPHHRGHHPHQGAQRQARHRATRSRHHTDQVRDGAEHAAYILSHDQGASAPGAEHAV
ncbi:hypothetical protein B0H17DRAFT_1132002 [Mycena rosella]|uniref:Uncharacterized protein n=1 Tax=Mycena rosella TaxID=1033263 RepID=A0AAD7GL92_MYCRO|nr:hypothetical protein B0H17DRAFT_1132002 [Mycena rosella]